MADIFRSEFLPTEHGDMENASVSEEAEKEIEEKKENEDEENMEQKASEINILDETESQPKIPTLEELADSDFIHNRHLAAKSIVEYLHRAGSDKEALHSVISVMCKLFEDEDLMVRTGLMENIPSIALFCKEHSEDLGVVIRQQIVPYTVKLLTDLQIQMRKVGHSTLLVLLENNIIDNSHLTEWICPLIAQLVITENENTSADVSVMCKMIPYVGKEITEKFFLEPFLSICCDRSSLTREVCMSHFGSLSKVLGRESTESILLPVFLDLCQDKLYKFQCVDVAVDLAGVVSSTTRHEVLSRVYIDFLNDKFRDVWHAAVLSLGRFISTFANPSKTGLCYQDGIWTDIPFDDDNVEDQLNSHNCFERLVPLITSSPLLLDRLSAFELNKLHTTDSVKARNRIVRKRLYASFKTAFDEKCENSNYSELVNVQNPLNSETECSNTSSLTVARKDGHLYLHVDNENLFNNFQFWRAPLPEIELDIDIEECKSANINVKAKIHNEEDISHTPASELNVRISPNQNSKNPDDMSRTYIDSKIIEVDKKPSSEENSVNDFSSIRFFDCVIYRNTGEDENCQMSIYDQNIVPPELLIEYVNDFSNEEDNRMNYAYYFPSVTYTLGRKYWPCIRSIFYSLARDVTYNVTKSVASSLHELAIILGCDITKTDLFPVFRDMLKDEKLRPIVLKHVSHFLRNLRISDRKQFLNLMADLCVWDEENNWRYRLTVAEQLIPCIELYTSCDALYFFSISLKLLQDKVCAVRMSAIELLAVSFRSIVTNPKSSEFLKAALFALDEKYRKANKWLWRQMYVYICQELAVKKSLPTELYVNEIVPNLFSLTWDTVPNVRLAVARCLGLTLLPLDFLPSIQRAHYQLLLQVMYSLQSDVDKDVRHFAHLSAAAFNVLPPKKLSPT